MKKILLFISIVTATCSNAQEPSKFSIGPSVGVHHAFLFPYSNWDFNPQWSAGLSCIYAPTQHWGIGADVRYSVEGAKLKLENRSTTMVLDYLRVPIKGMYFFGKYENDFRPKITLGPSIGFLMDEMNTYSAPANKVDFGYNVSGGFNYRLATDFWLNVDVNYYQGLTRVRNNSSNNEHNGNLGLQLGVLFGL